MPLKGSVNLHKHHLAKPQTHNPLCCRPSQCFILPRPKLGTLPATGQFGASSCHTLKPKSLMLQACFSACARIVVRELRKTETTDIIMVYSGTMHLICATIACIAVPGSVVILQHTWQVLTLLATGKKPHGNRSWTVHSVQCVHL